MDSIQWEAESEEWKAIETMAAIDDCHCKTISPIINHKNTIPGLPVSKVSTLQ
jgi:hypothetical protein